VPVLLHTAHLFTFTVRHSTLHRCHCWRKNQQPISTYDNCTIVV
jgi:hypothetical protein